MLLLILQFVKPAFEHLIMCQTLLLELKGYYGEAFYERSQRGHGFGILPDTYLSESGLKSENTRKE